MYCRFSPDAEGVYSRASCTWFIFAVMSFVPSYTAVTSWYSEKDLVKKELNQRQYSVNAMFFSRALVTVPFQTLQCLIFVAIV